MKKFLVQLAIGLALTGPAWAADVIEVAPEPVPESVPYTESWQYILSMYGFATSIQGTARFGNLPETDVDASFHDIIENLDMAFMGLAEARYGPYGIFGDLIYSSLSAGGSATGPLGGDWTVDIGNDLLIGTIGGEYRVIDNGKTTVDLMAGARFYRVDLDLDVTYCGQLCMNDGNIPRRGAHRSFDNHWVDPMIGAKFRIQQDSPWYLAGWGMVGGFGAGSELSWDLFGGIGYEFNDSWSLVGGYRGLGIDYESSGLDFNVVMQGPMFGLVFRF